MKEYLISMNDTIYGPIDNYVYLHLSAFTAVVQNTIRQTR